MSETLSKAETEALPAVPCTALILLALQPHLDSQGEFLYEPGYAFSAQVLFVANGGVIL